MVAGILGATGYAGAELVRILSGHSEIEKLVLSSVSFEGDRIENIYPNFLGRVSAELVKAEDVIAASDLVFAALPHGVGEPYAKAAVEKGVHFIDISADYRFDEDEDTFAAWYGKKYMYPRLRERSVYGLPEMNRKRIQELAAAGPVIIGNPGCYPTGVSLGAYPALARGMFGGGTIIADSASGVTGGGREPSRSYHFPECSDSMAPYKVGAHRHTPEIARNLSFMSALTPNLIFTPHLAPMNRGILSTIYIPLAPSWQAEGASRNRPPSKETEKQTAHIRSVYAGFYQNEPFVRVLPEGVTAATNRVRQSNYCDISVHLDAGGTTLIVVSAIDNMVKGAAGQAVQNMNIIFGFNEMTGLETIPALF
jgi:N-acetyl-gamma-glutamyl-phosphate reductase